MDGRPVTIVTGASRGLGAAIAQAAAQLGAAVVLAARSPGPLERLAVDIETAGGSALAVPADVSQEAGCRAIVQAGLDRFGTIHALVHNSGMLEPIAYLSAAEWAAWRSNWAVNVLGPVLLTRLALPALRENHGRVITISSGVAERVEPGWGAYSVSKAAVNHFTRILAVEEPAITAVVVRPGVVDTGMQAFIREQGQAGMPPENHRRYLLLKQQGRLLPPEIPGRALACLALYAPPDLSGSFISWDDPRMQDLVSNCFPGEPGKVGDND
jgi:NAD(P)-dependent dehydrogenase (short-subunit alcohol dehydrogenase family)